MISLLDYIDKGGQICMGMHIAECPRKGTPAVSWTYQIVSGGSSYTVMLIAAIQGNTMFRSTCMEVEDVGDISKEQIMGLIRDYWYSFEFHKDEKLNWEDMRILESDEIIHFYTRNKNFFENMIDYEKV